MASYVVHYIAGEQFLKYLIKTKRLTGNDINSFRLGNLIVDYIDIERPNVDNLSEDEVIRVNEEYRKKKHDRKIITHFRDKNRLGYILNSPNIDGFVNKYRELLDRDYSVLGYLFHLYTDKLFFEYLYMGVITCLDSEKRVTDILDECKYILINKNNKLITKEEFWSGYNNIYRDYDILNCFLLNKYNVDYKKDELVEFADKYFINPGIECVDYKNIREVIEKMDKFIYNSKDLDDKLFIFSRSYIQKFIDDCYFGFINYCEGIGVI